MLIHVDVIVGVMQKHSSVACRVVFVLQEGRYADACRVDMLMHVGSIC